MLLVWAVLALPAWAGDWRDLRWIDRASGESRVLGDHAGRIVVLDFFAYWCGPCGPASAQIEKGIAQHYEAELAGVLAPVDVIALNVESARPDRTDAFIKRAGLSVVGDDREGRALELLGARSLPFLAVLDLRGEQSAWRMVYHYNGFEGVDALRRVIDQAREEGGR